MQCALTRYTLLKAEINPADSHDKASGMLLLTCLHILFASIVIGWIDSSHQGLKS
ncbi:hypothetical protein GGE65_008014 [Skermanella aerolata]|uniref:hypothetical protein n=1 Tax=Skermanella aerolata TaxID=393310 RepID=UPI003D194FC3